MMKNVNWPIKFIQWFSVYLFIYFSFLRQMHIWNCFILITKLTEHDGKKFDGNLVTSLIILDDRWNLDL